MPLLVGSSPCIGCSQFRSRRPNFSAATVPSVRSYKHSSASSPLCTPPAFRRLVSTCSGALPSLPSPSADDGAHSGFPLLSKIGVLAQQHIDRLTVTFRRLAQSLAQGLGKILGSVALVLIAMMLGSQPAHAQSRVTEPPAISTSYVVTERPGYQLQQGSSSSGYSYTGIDLAALEEVDTSVAYPAPGRSGPVPKGFVPVGYEELMGSTVYSPADVPARHNKGTIAEQIHAIMEQYDNEDFDLGIKQFMIESAIQADLEDDIDKKGGSKDLEEKLAEALFANDSNKPREKIKTDDVVSDVFLTEMAEEALTVMGEAGSLKTAWRVQETLRELSYTQFWTLVSEGLISKVEFYGPQKRAVLVTTTAFAPGGLRTCKVVVPPDPLLFQHLEHHGVLVDEGIPMEDVTPQQALTVQMIRYTFPFMFISAIFWLLHTWLLDPMPNLLRRNEFLNYRRELIHIASQLNLRSPARQVKLKTDGPDFIPWDEIHGIDAVKKEILEIIDYLKNPELLRLKGVARIGGVMLAGSPGTGKTLLAKSIAAESGVKMFTCSGTDFFDIYNGVGARRIRETFEKIRANAPAILFIDEFDALGAARGTQAGGDESGSIISELLMQMDGFEDNRGVVVLGATNRPGAIDAALIRPGRFDRIVYMPLPDADGRAKILQVHARNKAVDPSINWYQVSRSMAGFTGADCMGLMQRAARMAARQGRDLILDEDIYSAMENKALEGTDELQNYPEPGKGDGLPNVIPVGLKKAIATYEAGKALLAFITPDFLEVTRISVCPFDLVTGYVLFGEDENNARAANLSRYDMESHIVVNLAGRCAEKLVMGESEMTGLGAPDYFKANMIAREMVLSMGFGPRTGPLDLMHVVQPPENKGMLLRTNESATEQKHYWHAADMSTEQSRVALADTVEILEAAEAKAFYGLAINWKPLQALVEALLERGVLQGDEVTHILQTNGVIVFPDPYLDHFGWDEDGALKYPHKPKRDDSIANSSTGGTTKAASDRTWVPLDPGDRDGLPKHGWHWNTPYTIKRDVPDWYQKEVDRYSY